MTYSLIILLITVIFIIIIYILKKFSSKEKINKLYKRKLELKKIVRSVKKQQKDERERVCKGCVVQFCCTQMCSDFLHTLLVPKELYESDAELKVIEMKEKWRT